MKASYLFDLANRCLSLAEACSDHRAKRELRGIAKELICKANDQPGEYALFGIGDSEVRPRRLDS